MAPLNFMTWWHWLALGLILVALEMAASGGFYVIFFGIAALAIGGLHLFGLAGPVWFQFLLFSVVSIVSLLLFRSPLLRLMGLDGPGVDVDSLVGEIATPVEDIQPGASRSRGASRHGVVGAEQQRRPAHTRPAVQGRQG